MKAFILSHPYEVAVLAYLALTALAAQLPARVRAWPVVGLLVRILARLGPLTHASARGTLKWPGVRDMIVSIAIEVAHETKPGESAK